MFVKYLYLYYRSVSCDQDILMQKTWNPIRCGKVLFVTEDINDLQFVVVLGVSRSQVSESGSYLYFSASLGLPWLQNSNVPFAIIASFWRLKQTTI